MNTTCCTQNTYTYASELPILIYTTGIVCMCLISQCLKLSLVWAYPANETLEPKQKLIYLLNKIEKKRIDNRASIFESESLHPAFTISISISLQEKKIDILGPLNCFFFVVVNYKIKHKLVRICHSSSFSCRVGLCHF